MGSSMLFVFHQSSQDPLMFQIVIRNNFCKIRFSFLRELSWFLWSFREKLDEKIFCCSRVDTPVDSNSKPTARRRSFLCWAPDCFTKQDSKSVSKLGEFLACIFSNLSRKLRQSSTSTKSNHRKILMLLGLSWRSNVGGLRPCETWWWWCVWGGAQLERARDSYEDQRLLDAMHKPMLCREWGSWWMSCVTGTQRSGWHRTLTEIFP